MEQNDTPRLIATLNRMLAKEHACSIRYATHAALITGPFIDPVSKRLQEIASDEVEHAAKLRTRICALGGMPTMAVDGDSHLGALTFSGIIRENMLEERTAIDEYGKILEEIPALNILLRRTIEDILQDEQEHLEELTALAPLGGEDGPGLQRSVQPEVLAGVAAQPPEQNPSFDSGD